MPTIINSNGSKWAGQAPDTVEKLLEVLGQEVLDRSFEPFASKSEDPALLTGVHFFGNFLNRSHVFNIESDDPAVVSRLVEAIKRNMTRDDYKSQPTREQVQEEKLQRFMESKKALKSRRRS